MLLLSTKTNNKIVRTDKRTDGRLVCKIVFSITFKVSFWCSKETSHFEHQKCLSENIIVHLFIHLFIYLYLRIVSKLTSKLNIKKRARVSLPAKCHLNGILWADLCGSDIVCWLGLLVMTCKTKRKLDRWMDGWIDR